MKLLIVPLIFLLYLLGCSIDNGDDIDVLCQLERNYNEKFVDEFRQTTVEDIYNIYVDSMVVEIAKALEVDTSTDNMLENAGITTSLAKTKMVMYYWHEVLNNKSFVLCNHLEKVKKERSKRKDKKKIIGKVSENNFCKFEIGDTMSLVFSVKVGVNKGKYAYRNAYMYGNPTIKVVKDEENDLYVDGILFQKDERTEFSDYKFHLIITKMNRNDTYLLMRTYDVGDTLVLPFSIPPSMISKI